MPKFRKGFGGAAMENKALRWITPSYGELRWEKFPPCGLWPSGKSKATSTKINLIQPNSTYLHLKNSLAEGGSRKQGAGSREQGEVGGRRSEIGELMTDVRIADGRLFLESCVLGQEFPSPSSQPRFIKRGRV